MISFPNDVVRLGEWWSPRLDVTNAAIRRRQEVLVELAVELSAWRTQGFPIGESREVALLIETMCPRTVPVVPLWNAEAGLVRSVGSAFLVNDYEGQTLLTARHVVLEENPVRMRTDLGGLIGGLPQTGIVDLGRRRAWQLHEHDITSTALRPIEAEELGGGVYVLQTDEPADIHVAYGFPRSVNSQRHRLKEFRPQLQEAVLYEIAGPPLTFLGDVASSLFLTYRQESSFVTQAGRMQPLPSPRGMSGGLIAGYFNRLACWSPVAVLVEKHDQPGTLVGSLLSSMHREQPAMA